MSYEFRPAVTSEAKNLVGLYSESGCGKTFSALLLAKGFVDDMTQVGMLETEGGRGEMYASDPVVGGYGVVSLRESFSSEEYGEAIAALEKAGVRVGIIDSASHEWQGPGGVLAKAALNEKAGMSKNRIWTEPKMTHEREFTLRLLASPIQLIIVCMRAKYTMMIVDREYQELAKARNEPVPKLGDWVRNQYEPTPKQSEDILFEMMVHGWLDEQHRFHCTKPRAGDDKTLVAREMRTIFIDNQPISVGTGQRFAKYAAGAAPGPVSSATPAATATKAPGAAAPASAARSALTDPKARTASVARIMTAAEKAGWASKDLLRLLLGHDVKRSSEITNAEIWKLDALTDNEIAAKMEAALEPGADG
jgi:hypothetical protein